MKLARTLAALLSVATAATAAADGRFDALRGRAEALDSLGPFLEKYVGVCKDEFARADCERNVQAVRRAADGRTFAARVGEQTLEIVKPQRTARGYRFVVTPFIDGGGLALTNGQPRRQDAEGHPLIGFIVLDGALPPGMDEMALEQALRTGRLELEVVFRPEGTWRLRRGRQAGFYEGVKARFLGLRLVETRTRAEIASKVL